MHYEKTVLLPMKNNHNLLLRQSPKSEKKRIVVRFFLFVFFVRKISFFSLSKLNSMFILFLLFCRSKCVYTSRPSLQNWTFNSVATTENTDNFVFAKSHGSCCGAHIQSRRSEAEAATENNMKQHALNWIASGVTFASILTWMNVRIRALQANERIATVVCTRTRAFAQRHSTWRLLRFAFGWQKRRWADAVDQMSKTSNELKQRWKHSKKETRRGIGETHYGIQLFCNNKTDEMDSNEAHDERNGRQIETCVFCRVRSCVYSLNFSRDLIQFSRLRR